MSIFVFGPGKGGGVCLRAGNGRKCVFEPGKEGMLSLNQERKDIRSNRILLIYSSFLSWFRTKSVSMFDPAHLFILPFLVQDKIVKYA